MAPARSSRVLRTISLILIVGLFCPFVYGKVIYVDAAGQADFDIGAGSKLEQDTFFSGLIDDVRIYNRAIRP